MARQSPDRKLWIPQTSADQTLVWSELTGIFQSPQFSSSKRYPSFLRYVVEQALAGNSLQLKERTIGIEVFGRNADYDTNNDTVVRYTAGEVRKRLALYYLDHKDAALEITIPPGSYAPEFQRLEESAASDKPALLLAETAQADAPTHAWNETNGRQLPSWHSVRLYVVSTIVLLAVAIAAVTNRVHAARASAVDRFWRPVLHNRGTPLLVPGVVVFSPNPYSGTETATQNTEYPFVSLQITAATARMSGLLQKNGSPYQMQPASATTLSDLRDRSVILIGAYNNYWTKRLLQDTQFHLDKPATPAIINTTNPAQHWQRDHSLPYSSSDDYAVFGRFHDKTTGSLIVVVAGLGRNGTEAAAEFVTEPRYLAELESRMGRPIGEQDVEAVLKINVVAGQTGAPSLEAVTVW